MADLGSISATLAKGGGLHFPFPLYFTWQITRALSSSGELAGVVTELGNPVQHVLVTVHWRPTMQPIARAWTDANGEWSVRGFDPAQGANYAVTIQDPAGGTQYNDAIYALVAPVEA